MKKMHIEQEDYIKTETTKFLEEYKERKDVGCIYLLANEEHNLRRNNFNLVIVFENGVSKTTLKEFNKLNNCFSRRDSIESFGGLLTLVADDCTDYSNCADTPDSIKRVRDLLSSEILYDKEGEYTKIAHQFDTYRKVDKYSDSFNLDIESHHQKLLERK
jgi:hypothetical protein